jgi:hypothetical protein
MARPYEPVNRQYPVTALKEGPMHSFEASTRRIEDIKAEMAERGMYSSENIRRLLFRHRTPEHENWAIRSDYVVRVAGEGGVEGILMPRGGKGCNQNIRFYTPFEAGRIYRIFSRKKFVEPMNRETLERVLIEIADEWANRFL